MSSPRWKTLDLNLASAPNLLLKSRFDTSGYEITLTDLSRLWAATLSKEGIIQQASDQGSSIDPSQDDEQFSIFLSKIESALSGDQGTSLHVRGNEDGTCLSMRLSAPLPAPLPQFEWTIQFQRLPEQQIESELVTPLLQQASRLQHQIQNLIDELHDKDRVIAKITDRLETSGNDLTTVFPGVSNIKTTKKKSQREQLARYVKGLADFDESVWKSQSVVRASEQDLDDGAVADVFRNLPVSVRTAPPVADWWERSDGKSASKIKEDASRAQQTVDQNNFDKDSHSDVAAEGDDTTEGQFQRQGTPPGLRQHLHGSAKEEQRAVSLDEMDLDDVGDSVQAREQAREESSTEDEDDDLDAVLKRPSSSQPHIQSSGSSPKKLGQIGGRKAPDSDPSPPKASGEPTARARLGVIGGRSNRQAAPATEDPPLNEGPTKEKPRAKLGAIGGKSATCVNGPDPRGPETESVRTDSRPTSIDTKMGVVGGKKRQAPAPTDLLTKPGHLNGLDEDLANRQSRQTLKQDTPSPRERSEERADRKRDQLKRELEEKAKAPAKKKRKF